MAGFLDDVDCGSQTGSIASAGYSVQSCVDAANGTAKAAASSVGSSAGSTCPAVGSDVAGKDWEGPWCKVCGVAASEGQSYCRKHRQAFECIQRQAIKGTEKGTVETPEYKAFCTVFGRAARKATKDKPAVTAVKCDEALANKVLVDFLENFPDGKESTGTKSSKGKFRGQINLCQYIHTHEVEHEKATTEEEGFMDFEFFWIHMENTRKWKYERSKKMWNQLEAALEANPSLPHDHKGPPESPLRLAIPAWATGRDSEVSKTAEREKKALQISNKAAAMTMEQQDQVRKEIRSGFGSLLGIGSSSSSGEHMFAAQSLNAMTREGDAKEVALVGGLDLLKQATAAPATDKGKGEKRAAEAPAVSESSPSKQAKMDDPADKPEILDIPAARNRAFQSGDKTIEAEKKKVEKLIQSSRGVLAEGNMLGNQDFYVTLAQRVDLLCALLGLVGFPDKNYNRESLEEIAFQSIVSAPDDHEYECKNTKAVHKIFIDCKKASPARTLTNAQLATAYLRSLLCEMEHMPVEKVESAISLVEVHEKSPPSRQRPRWMRSIWRMQRLLPRSLSSSSSAYSVRAPRRTSPGRTRNSRASKSSPTQRRRPPRKQQQMRAHDLQIWQRRESCRKLAMSKCSISIGPNTTRSCPLTSTPWRATGRSQEEMME